MANDPDIPPGYKKVVMPQGYAIIPDNAPPRRKSHHHQKRGRQQPNPIKLPLRQVIIRLVFPPYLAQANGFFDIAERPARNREYTLEVGAEKLSGKTDDKGVLREEIHSDATSGMLTIGIWKIPLTIGDLQQPDAPKGAKARLSNLGLYTSAALDDQSDDRFWRAVARFIALFGASDRKDFFPAGPKIKEIHGS